MPLKEFLAGDIIISVSVFRYPLLRSQLIGQKFIFFSASDRFGSASFHYWLGIDRFSKNGMCMLDKRGTMAMARCRIYVCDSIPFDSIWFVSTRLDSQQVHLHLHLGDWRILGATKWQTGWGTIAQSSRASVRLVGGSSSATAQKFQSHEFILEYWVLSASTSSCTCSRRVRCSVFSCLVLGSQAASQVKPVAPWLRSSMMKGWMEGELPLIAYAFCIIS